ncbi:MAG: Gfo/Idh/MocA family oxidoreductase [Clostridia bacterium]|nr:Gfo/Idh/MocA family oxidoreductase [Clostridia bacterium]
MKILLIGAGGYGAHYIKALLGDPEKKSLLKGVVEPYFDTCPTRDLILASGVPVYPDAKSFYRENRADLAILATPVFLHSAQAVFCLKNGSHVLCEKPVAPTVEEAEAMERAMAETGKFLAVGYQWSFSEAILRLKKDILSGRLGKPKSMKTLILWPRKKEYYARGVGWAGKMEREGVPVLDSIASNACAHYIHNMLFLLGPSLSESADPEEVTGSCYRAYPIETFDTCTISLRAGGVPLYFSASHVASPKKNPVFSYEFEKGTVFYDGDGEKRVRALLADGTEIDYGSPEEGENPVVNKLNLCIAAAKTGVPPVCTVKTAMAHTKVIRAIHQSISVRNFPAERIRETEDRFSVEGLAEALLSRYESSSLLEW